MELDSYKDDRRERAEGFLSGYSGITFQITLLQELIQAKRQRGQLGAQRIDGQPGPATHSTRSPVEVLSAQIEVLEQRLGELEIRRTAVLADITRALEKLPPEIQRTVLLRYVNGLTQREIAEAEGRGQAAISMRLGKALEAVADYLAEKVK